MELIKKYFPDISNDKINKLQRFAELFKDWNSKINLISRNDVKNLEERHILHSLAIAKFIDFPNGAKVADVGTGGGFPGMPLAIMFPKVHFYLIDSIRKKINVVSNISEKIELTNVTPIWSRVENTNHKFDFIVSRAVTALPNFVKLTRGKIQKNKKSKLKNGIIYLKGGDIEDEISGLKNVQIKNICELFDREFFESKKIIYFF